ncbi:hypothetical protein ACNKHR_09525 [Shigella flexneri]
MQKLDTASHRTFNEFFVCPLRDKVRPIDTDPNVLSCLLMALSASWVNRRR